MLLNAKEATSREDKLRERAPDDCEGDADRVWEDLLHAHTHRKIHPLLHGAVQHRAKHNLLCGSLGPPRANSSKDMPGRHPTRRWRARAPPRGSQPAAGPTIDSTTSAWHLHCHSRKSAHDNKLTLQTWSKSRAVTPATAALLCACNVVALRASIRCRPPRPTDPGNPARQTTHFLPHPLALPERCGTMEVPRRLFRRRAVPESQRSLLWGASSRMLNELRERGREREREMEREREEL